MNTISIIARYLTITILCLIGLTIVLPVIDRPDVRTLLVASTQVIIIIGTASVATLVVSYTWHKMETWHRQLPPSYEPTVPSQFASSRDALALVADEAATPVLDHRDLWKASITRFALLGNLQGFSWQSMAAHVGRDDWRTCLGLMTDAEVLTVARGRNPSRWAGAWSYPKFRMAIKYDRLMLPFPADVEPPVVSWSKFSERQEKAYMQNMQSIQSTQGVDQ